MIDAFTAITAAFAHFQSDLYHFIQNRFYGWLHKFEIFKTGCENHGNLIHMSKIQGQNEIRKCLLLCQGEKTFYI